MDLLLVADPLPSGRIPRVQEFREVVRRLKDALAEARRDGFDTRLSTLFKTPAEVRRGSPLFLDMLEDAIFLFDRDEFFRNELEQLRARLKRLGSRRVWVGDSWYWDLKPDFKPGDTVEF